MISSLFNFLPPDTHYISSGSETALFRTQFRTFGSGTALFCAQFLSADPEQLSSALNSYLRIRNSSVPYSTTCPLATQISEITPSSSAAISFISFMASTTQRVCPFATLSPMET